MKPKEDPKDRADRLRERRMSDVELTKATESNAASLTSDLEAVYNISKAPKRRMPLLAPTAAPSVFGTSFAGQKVAK